MKKISLALLLATLMIVSLFSGCGGASGTSGGAAPAASDAATADSSKPVTIRLFIPYGAEEPGNKPTVAIVDQFMKDNPNITVELEVQAGTQYHDKLSTEMASDTLANIFVSWGGSEIYEIVKAGKIVELTDFINNSDPSYKDGIMPLALTNSNVTYEDIPGLWGVPFSNVAAGFYYNKELFEKAGVTPPETWDDMYITIEKLKAIDTIPWVIGGKDGWRVEHIYSDLFYKINGVGATKDLANRTMKYVDEGATRPWDVLLKVKDMGGFGPDPASVDFGMEQTLFKTGKAAMNFSLSAFVGSFSGEDSDIKDIIGFFPTPYFSDKPDFAKSVFGGGDCGYNISASQTPEELAASFKLVTALTDRAAQESYLNANAFLLTRTDLQGDPAKVNPLMTDFSDMLENCTEMETDVTNPDKVSGALNQIRSIGTAVINGQFTPQQAGEEMDSYLAKNSD